MTLPELSAFLGWCAVINIGLLCLTAAPVMLAGDRLSALHHRLFGVDRAEMRRLYIWAISIWKILLWVFVLVPWLALQAMG